MNNRQVAEQWRLQTNRVKNGHSMYYEGKTIYSYGSHFPMAYITGLQYGLKDIVLQNSDSDSNSTAKHLNHMRSQCRNDATIEIPTNILKELIREFEFSGASKAILDIARVEIQKRIAYYEGKKARARLHKDIYQYPIDDNNRQLEILNTL